MYIRPSDYSVVEHKGIFYPPIALYSDCDGDNCKKCISQQSRVEKTIFIMETPNIPADDSAVISPFDVAPCTKPTGHPEMPYDVFFFRDGCIKVDTTSSKTYSNITGCPPTMEENAMKLNRFSPEPLNLLIADHSKEFRPLILKTVKINLTHTLDFNPETEILDRQIASMMSDSFAYWEKGQKNFVIYGLIVTMVFTAIFVVVILVIPYRKLRVLKMYSKQNDDLIRAEITLEQGISVFGHKCSILGLTPYRSMIYLY